MAAGFFDQLFVQPAAPVRAPVQPRASRGISIAGACQLCGTPGMEWRYHSGSIRKVVIATGRAHSWKSCQRAAKSRE